jgi:hypothetical protein
MFSPENVCDRAQSRRQALRRVLDGPGSDAWKLEQVRGFLEEADADEPWGICRKCKEPMRVNAEMICLTCD